MTKEKNEEVEETEVAELKNCYVRIKDQEYAIRAEKIEKKGEHSIIYWTTKEGKAKKTTVLNTEIAQIDEDV